MSMSKSMSKSMNINRDTKVSELFKDGILREKEFLEILTRFAEKGESYLNDWEKKFIHSCRATYHQSQSPECGFLSVKQTEKLREIAEKLWKD
jgi:hypothetical protein